MTARYRIEIKRSAQKEILALQKKDAQRIVAEIQNLAHEPRGRHSKKLSAQERYRLRIGAFRILYEIQDDILVVWVVRVAHLREAYR